MVQVDRLLHDFHLSSLSSRAANVYGPVSEDEEEILPSASSVRSLFILAANSE